MQAFHCMKSCRFLALVLTNFQNTARESHCVRPDTIPKKKMFFFNIFSTPGHLGTMVHDNRKIDKTSEKLAKSLQGPLVELCQINYYSGRQKDNSKTICRRAGYWQLASVVVNEGDEAKTTNLCQKCFNNTCRQKEKKRSQMCSGDRWSKRRRIAEGCGQ